MFLVKPTLKTSQLECDFKNSVCFSSAVYCAVKNLVDDVVKSQLSWAGEHGQQVLVVAQIFLSAASQSCSTLSVSKPVLREDVRFLIVVVVHRHLLLRLLVLQRHRI